MQQIEVDGHTVVDLGDEHESWNLALVERQRPVGEVRMARRPIPHLRDDEGVIFSADELNLPKLAHIVFAVMMDAAITGSFPDHKPG